MSFKNIIIQKQNTIALLTINRPSVYNALDRETLIECERACDDFEHDQTIKVVVITGQGKSFIAGADIKHMKNMTSLEAQEFAELGQRLLFKIEHSRVPYIAAVNGYALGGGCELLMACDIVIAAKTAKIGQPEINLGIHPGFGGTQRLPRRCGIPKAKELLLTGDVISADEAFEIGLVNKVVDDDQLMNEVNILAEKISLKSPLQLRFIKELVNKGVNLDLSHACALERASFSVCFSTNDQKEGMTAFLEKRKPQFQGK
ncbi:MAG: enoyl-CoA hydratase-related protein [Candidatus Thermoplasmatota archaeon]